MVKKIEKFIEENVKIYQIKALKVLESCAVLYPALLAEVIPVMSTAVKASETKRGVGVDKHLRLVRCKMGTGRFTRSKH